MVSIDDLEAHADAASMPVFFEGRLVGLCRDGGESFICCSSEIVFLAFCALSAQLGSISSCLPIINIKSIAISSQLWMCNSSAVAWTHTHNTHTQIVNKATIQNSDTRHRFRKFFQSFRLLCHCMTSVAVEKLKAANPIYDSPLLGDLTKSLGWLGCLPDLATWTCNHNITFNVFCFEFLMAYLYWGQPNKLLG